jgi:hypothetical protein
VIRDLRSLSGGAVKELTGGVGVASVASGLVDQVEQDPAKVGSVFRPARLVKRRRHHRGVCGCGPLPVGSLAAKKTPAKKAAAKG